MRNTPSLPVVMNLVLTNTQEVQRQSEEARGPSIAYATWIFASEATAAGMFIPGNLDAPRLVDVGRRPQVGPSADARRLQAAQKQASVHAGAVQQGNQPAGKKIENHDARRPEGSAVVHYQNRKAS